MTFGALRSGLGSAVSSSVARYSATARVWRCLSVQLAEVDRVIAGSARFGCVLADAGYGLSAPFRQELTRRNLTWAVGIPRHLKVYLVGVN